MVQSAVCFYAAGQEGQGETCQTLLLKCASRNAGGRQGRSVDGSLGRRLCIHLDAPVQGLRNTVLCCRSSYACTNTEKTTRSILGSGWYMVAP